MEDEKIWVIEKLKLLDLVYFNGYANIAVGDFVTKINNNKIILDRTLAEVDEKYKQPITYIIIFNFECDKVFGYIRQGIESAVIREIEEELNIEFCNLFVHHCGYINLDNSPVNRVHFGLVYMADLKKGYDLKLKGSENKSGMWLSVDDLESMQFEDWSEIFKPVVIGLLSKK